MIIEYSCVSIEEKKCLNTPYVTKLHFMRHRAFNKVCTFVWLSPKITKKLFEFGTWTQMSWPSFPYKYLLVNLLSDLLKMRLSYAIVLPKPYTNLHEKKIAWILTLTFPISIEIQIKRSTLTRPCDRTIWIRELSPCFCITN